MRSFFIRSLCLTAGAVAFVVFKNSNTIINFPFENKQQPVLRETTAPTSTGRKKQWVNWSIPILPLVEPFQGELNERSGEPIFYDPKKGYSFPVNGQGGRWNNHFYPAERLTYRLEPDKVFSKQEGIQCLGSQWIHIDGDSLARDLYYDLTELYGMSWNNKKKTLDPQQFHAAPTITFDGGTIEMKETPNWVGLDANASCPDIWIYSSGLWDHPARTSFEKYVNRTKLLAKFDSSCVKHKILRYTTPYQDRRVDENKRTQIYNGIATSILSDFKILDSYKILESRRDLSHDGVHYTGPGSKWVTNSLFNLLKC